MMLGMMSSIAGLLTWPKETSASQFLEKDFAVERQELTQGVCVVTTRCGSIIAGVSTGLQKTLVPLLQHPAKVTTLEVQAVFITGHAATIAMIQTTRVMEFHGREGAALCTAITVDKTQEEGELSTTSTAGAAASSESVVTTAVVLFETFLVCAGNGWTASKGAVLPVLSSLLKARGRLMNQLLSVVTAHVIQENHQLHVPLTVAIKLIVHVQKMRVIYNAVESLLAVWTKVH